MANFNVARRKSDRNNPFCTNIKIIVGLQLLFLISILFLQSHNTIHVFRINSMVGTLSWLVWVYIRGGGKTMWLLCKTVLTSDRGNESEVCIIVLWHNSLISNANSYSSFLSVTKGTLDWKNVFWPAMSTMIWKKEFWSKQKKHLFAWKRRWLKKWEIRDFKQHLTTNDVHQRFRSAKINGWIVRKFQKRGNPGNCSICT